MAVSCIIFSVVTAKSDHKEVQQCQLTIVIDNASKAFQLLNVSSNKWGQSKNY